MRGKVPDVWLHWDSGRITPAYAGKRVRRFIHIIMFWDHPRLCGEKLACHDSQIRQLGSPPPMRGKAFGRIHVVFRQGITPAYAGKRCELQTECMVIWDHPRLCGEKLKYFDMNTGVKGSPPPMRGKARELSRKCKRGRITPAYAGKSPLVVIDSSIF